MKKSISVLLLIGISFYCSAQQGKVSASGVESSYSLPADSIMKTSNFISKDEAAQILGGRAYVRDSLYKVVNGYLRFLFTYYAVKTDTLPAKTLFFSLEQYSKQDGAAVSYVAIKAENEKTLKSENLAGIGDEAVIIKDQAGFSFIMAKKRNRLYKFKLRNKTDKASLEKLISVVQKVLAD